MKTDTLFHVLMTIESYQGGVYLSDGILQFLDRYGNTMQEISASKLTDINPKYYDKKVKVNNTVPHLLKIQFVN